MEKLSAALENAKTLSRIVGIEEPMAAEMLKGSIAISFDPSNSSAGRFAAYIKSLLIRTVRKVSLNSCDAGDFVEIVLGDCLKRGDLNKTVYVSLSGGKLWIGTSRPGGGLDEGVHRAILLLASCYVSAFAFRVSLLSGVNNLPSRDPLEVDLYALPGYSSLSTISPIGVPDGTFMAGAGAIGNAFIWGLEAFNLTGALIIADPDFITAGNLNRCVLFNDNDVGQMKAVTLAREAGKIIPSLRVGSESVELSKVQERGSRRWLKQLIVTVDSRRARRRLQTEIPREVYDASTTGVEEIVLHFNKQPETRACLGCIYKEDDGERLHEKHVAAALGVSTEDVQSGWITPIAAKAITSRYKDLHSEELVGIAYDTLFKQLCGQQALITSSDQQVLAPFAFVSALAGIYLAIEYVLRNQPSQSGRFNYWRASPWAEPNPRAMSLRPRDPQCVVCNDPVYHRIALELWDFRSD